MDLTTVHQKQLSEIESKLVLSLVYFDLFKYPLTLQEIIRFSRTPVAEHVVWETALDNLVNNKIVFQHGPYFSLIENEALEQRRKLGTTNAMQLMEKAVKYARIIQYFPFVASVCISGSLSKGCVNEEGDIDYFIITKPQKLWIARSLLILFKKTILFNNHKYFCVNYFIDTEHLEIPDKNIFTATELLTLIPMSGFETYNKLIEKNKWAFNYLPNVSINKKVGSEQQKPFVTKFLERLLGGYLGNVIDNQLMKLTIKWWQKKFGTFSQEELDSAMRSRKYVSKHHPQQFQQLVLNGLRQSITQFEAKLKVKLHG
jgi:hypothetical protein